MESTYEALIILVIAAGWVLYVTYVIPEIKKNREINFFEYLISGPWYMQNLLEYRRICLSKNVPLLWFYISILLLILFIIIIIFWFSN
jgi:hypothetical protein